MPGQHDTSGRTFLEDLSRELSSLAAMIALYAEEDARRREAVALGKVSVRQVEAAIAARQARGAAFGLDLEHPGWSILLELFRAALEERAVKLPRLAAEAQVAPTTLLRWIDLFCEKGLAERRADPERVGGVLVSLTGAGVEAMRGHFEALNLGWARA